MPDTRILLITRNLPPLIGGMERLILEATLGLSQHSSLTVIGPNGCKPFLPDAVATHEVPHQLAPFIVQSLWRARSLATENAFDVVIGGSGLCAPAVLMAAKRAKAKSALFIHGLDIVVNHWAYQCVFLPCIRRIDQIIANSRNTQLLAQKKGVSHERIAVVNPGTHLPDMNIERDDLRDSTARYAEFCQRHEIPFARFILFTGRMTQRKGLARFLAESLPEIVRAAPDIGLVVVGHAPSDSLNQRGEEASVHAAVTAAGLAPNIRFLGTVSDAELTQCYTHASAQVFPLRDVPGDIEGFGMVAVEAAACGTPTVAFNVGGVSDAVTQANGYLVPPDNYSQFAQRVVDILDQATPTDSTCREFAAQFAWPIYNENIKALITALKPQSALDNRHP